MRNALLPLFEATNMATRSPKKEEKAKKRYEAFFEMTKRLRENAIPSLFQEFSYFYLNEMQIAARKNSDELLDLLFGAVPPLEFFQ